MDDVQRWLAALGLDQYARAFEENAVDWALLPRTEERFALAEIHRLEGELLLSSLGAAAAPRAEACLQAALEVARAQSADRGSSGPRPASRGSGATRAGGPRRASSSHRSMPGSPRASAPMI